MEFTSLLEETSPPTFSNMTAEICPSENMVRKYLGYCCLINPHSLVYSPICFLKFIFLANCCQVKSSQAENTSRENRITFSVKGRETSSSSALSSSRVSSYSDMSAHTKFTTVSFFYFISLTLLWRKNEEPG